MNSTYYQCKTLFIFLFFILSLVNSNAQCDRTQDSLSLVQLYTSTGGEDWHITWDLGQPLEEWHGIELTPEGCVRTINLDSNNLIDTFPNLILSEVTGISLDKNNISGPLLDYDGLPKISHFSISDNNITGSIPNFSKMPLVKYLYINGNALTGNIPEFDKLPLLRNFYCVENQLTGSIPYLHNCSELREYHCAKNLLTGIIPNISNKPDLYTFHCYENLLTGSIPNFNDLPSLKHFFCRFNNLTGSIPNFEHFNTLSWFNCSNNNITGEIPEDHSNHTNLVNYKIGNNDIRGCYPDWICDLTFSSMGNNKLPWYGNHEKYCENENQEGAPCHDGIENNEPDQIEDDCRCNEAITTTEEIVQSKGYIYPNPNYGTFYISIPIVNGSMAQLKIYDLQGQLVYDSPLSEINTGDGYTIKNLVNGLYFFTIADGDEMLVKEKIVFIKE